MTSTETPTTGRAATKLPIWFTLPGRFGALGARARALDPVATVGWLIAVGLALVVTYVLIATPLVPTFPEETFRTPWTLERLWDTRVSHARMQDWLGLARPAGVSVVVGVLVARRWVAVGTVLVVWPLIAIALFGTFVWGWWLALAAVAVVTAYGRLRRAVVPFLLAAGVQAVWNAGELTMFAPGSQGTSSGGVPGWWAVFGSAAYTAAAIAVSATIGAALRTRVRAAAARAAERDALTVESTTAARAELARDLHDVVAHHVSLVAVRAESAPYTYPDLDEDARAVLREIAADARSALDELRHVLAVLGRGADRPELAPQPGADAITDLVDEARAAGQQVELIGTVTGIPAAPGYVLYRAAQEGLTNARRHAPGAVTVLTLTHRDGVLGLRIANPVVGELDESGRGLIGMRERVEALGGALSTGVENDTFVVVVTLPVDAR